MGIPAKQTLGKPESRVLRKGPIVDALGDAARRARDARFDAVEFHAGVGGLINQFVSVWSAALA